MARAKRTDRTEARRRYRAEQAALPEDERDDADEAPAPPARATTAKASSTKAGSPAQRPSIMGALRAAYHPVDLRADLRSSRQVLLHWGVLGAMGISVVAAVAFILTYNDALAAIPAGKATPEQLNTALAASPVAAYGWVFLQPPPILGAFLIGMTSKRASWLGGLVYGLFTIILAAVVASTPAGRIVTQDGLVTPSQVVAQFVILAPIGGMLLASLAAWYRRFLDLANPARQQQRRAKPPQRRGDMRQKPAR